MIGMDLRKNKVAMFLKDMCKTSCDEYDTSRYEVCGTHSFGEHSVLYDLIKILIWKS